MNRRPDVVFADRVSRMRLPEDEPGKRLNAALAEATRACSHLVFDGTVIRVELYHLRHAAGGTRVGWHRHPFTELTWVEGGPIDYGHGEQRITVRDGQCFLMPALTPHCWSAPEAPAVLHGFMLTVLPAADPGHSMASHLCETAAALGYRVPAVPGATDALRQAEQEAVRPDTLGVQAAAGFLRVGVVRLFRRVLAAVSIAEAPLPSALSRPPAALERAVAFITAHLAEPLDVPAVARHATLSTRQLDRLFHAVFDMPVGAFLVHTRLERARYLLGDSDLSIKQVAHACGFADPNYFSRVFRRRHGQSPGAYRSKGDTKPN